MGSVDQDFHSKANGGESTKKIMKIICGLNLEKANNRVYREAIWQVLRMQKWEVNFE